MTRKRYIKLKMAEGLSRNEAVQNANEIAAEGLSYQEDYDADAECLRFAPEQLRIFCESMQAVVPVFAEFAQRIIRASNAALETFAHTLLEELEASE